MNDEHSRETVLGPGRYRIRAASGGGETRVIVQRAAANTHDLILEVIDADTMQLTPQRRTAHSGPIFTLASDGKGTLFSGGADETIRVWSDVLEKRNEIVGDVGRIMDMACSPDGNTLAWVGDKGEDLFLYDIATGESSTRSLGITEEDGGAERPMPFSVALSPSGKRIAAGGLYMRTKIFQLMPRRSCRLKDEVEKSGDGAYFGARALAFSADGQILAKGEDGTSTFQLWNGKNGKFIRKLRGHHDYVDAIAFHPTASNILATGAGQNDGSTKLWDLARGTRKLLGRQREREKDGVNDTKFDPTGSILLSVGDDDIIRIFDVERKACLRKIPAGQHGLHAVAFVTPETFATGGSDGTIRTWSLKELLKTITKK